MNKTLGAAAALFLMTIRVSAHHAFAAEYDEQKLVMVSGTVTGIQWTNPHAWMYVSGRDENGTATSWAFEMGSPGGLTHRGWKKGELKKGDRVAVDGYASKNHANVANARTVTLPNGKKLFGGFASTPGNPTAK
jgi:Family of unknown function (DUF6152)